MQIGTQASIPKERLPMLSGKHEVNVHHGKRWGHEVVSPYGRNPFGVESLFNRIPRVAAFAATLGCRPKPLWG